MPSEFELRGAVKLARVAKALQEQSDAGKGFRKGLQSELVRASKPARKDLKAAILDGLPKSGGLAEEVSRSASFVLATNKSRGAVVGVRIQGRRRGKRGATLRRMNRGVVRHPVFGNRKVWVDQTEGVHAGFLDRAFARHLPELRTAVLKALEDSKNTIYRSIR